MSYHSWTSKPPTKEYQDAHPGEFSKWAEKYCGTCGRLPAFCECLDKAMARAAVRAVQAVDAGMERIRKLPREKRG